MIMKNTSAFLDNLTWCLQSSVGGGRPGRGYLFVTFLEPTALLDNLSMEPEMYRNAKETVKASSPCLN